MGVKGYELPDTTGWGARAAEAIDRDVVLLPEVLLQEQGPPARVAFKAAFDALWQAAGEKRSTGYDDAGEWREDVHREWER
jgi:hypothetical protein